MPRMYRAFGIALLSVCALWAFGSSARAQTETYSLSNVVFNDGGTASGDIVLNVYGFIAGGTIVTTAAGLFPGGTYLGIGGPIAGTISPDGLEVTFFGNNYGTFVAVDFAQPLASVTSGADAITGVLEECLFSCSPGYTPAVARTVVLADSPTALVPEPPSLALLAGGLLLLLPFGRRVSRRRA